MKRSQIPLMEMGEEAPEDLEQAMAQSVNKLTGINNIELLSDLSSDEIKLLIAIKIVGKELNDKLLNNIVKEYPKFKVSKERKGREEITGIAKSVKEEISSRGMLQKLKGWIGI